MVVWTFEYTILNLETGEKSSATHFFIASTETPFKEHDQWKIKLFPLTAMKKRKPAREI